MAHNEQEQSEQSYELRTVQCRMARAALGWGVRDLAGAAEDPLTPLPDLNAGRRFGEVQCGRSGPLLSALAASSLVRMTSVGPA